MLLQVMKTVKKKTDLKKKQGHHERNLKILIFHFFLVGGGMEQVPSSPCEKKLENT